MDIRIFIPAFNVGKTIRSLIEEFSDAQYILKKKGHGLKVLFINDCSEDKTKEIIEQALKENKWVEIINNEKNLGNATNIIAGYTWGANSDCDIVGCMDADGEHSPYAMIRHLKMIEQEKCDGISGSIIFPDHHVDRKAVEKTMLEINSLNGIDNGDVMKKALWVYGISV